MQDKKQEPVRLEELKIVVAIGKYRWKYHATKDGSVDVGAMGAAESVNDPVLSARGQQALTTFIEEIRKGAKEAKRRIIAGETPKTDNGTAMFEAAGINMGKAFG